MEYDWDAIDFGGDVMEIAMRKYNASCGNGADSEPFVEQLRREYEGAGSPKKRKAWIIERLKDEFKYVDKPPRWIESEPAWAYLNGKPMVFICQQELKRGPVTSTALTHDCVVYVFGARVPREDGLFEVVYRVVEQHRGF